MIEWISVEERLPEKEQRVLIYTKDEHIFDYNNKKVKVRIASFLKGRIRESHESCGFPDYHPDIAPNNYPPYGFKAGLYQWNFNEVTHWAEINEPEKNK